MHIDNNYELYCPAIEEWLYRLTTVHLHIHNVLKQINHKQSTLHIGKARQYSIDDWVLVDRHNLQVKARKNKSQKRKWFRSYKVLKAIGSHDYQLEVPEAIQ